MNELDAIRTQIDGLDETIMTTLESRFGLMREVKRIKALNGLQTTDSNREASVLNKAEKFTFSQSIQTVYQTIMHASKALQK